MVLHGFSWFFIGSTLVSQGCSWVFHGMHDVKGRSGNPQLVVWIQDLNPLDFVEGEWEIPPEPADGCQYGYVLFFWTVPPGCFRET